MTLEDALKELIKQYPPNTALIRWSEDGWEFQSAIGAMPPKDNEETLRAWLKKWHPKAEFLGYAIQ